MEKDEGKEEQEEPVEPTEETEIEEDSEAPETEETTEEPVEAEAKTEEIPAPTEEKKEAKPSPREEKRKEEEIVEERIYTIPLGKALVRPQRKRTPRAMRMIKEFVVKHMKMEARKEEEEEEEPRKLVISNEVNEKIWGRGIEKPPRKIRVRVTKDKEGNVSVYLAEGD